ncbi:MAG: hypothetical protein ACYTDX_10030 [Planctomycetota bacterium]|jgi:hypothetical protein
MTRALALLAAATLCVLGCVSDPHGEPLPDREVPVALRPGAPMVSARWPVAYRRGAEFRILNRTGVAVETVLLEFVNSGSPREVTDVIVQSPVGHTAEILPAPHGTWPLRALIGVPGRTLMEDGGEVIILVRVNGSPGAGVAEFRVPGLTPK